MIAMLLPLALRWILESDQNWSLISQVDGTEKYQCACRDGYIDKNPSKPGEWMIFDLSSSSLLQVVNARNWWTSASILLSMIAILSLLVSIWMMVRMNVPFPITLALSQVTLALALWERRIFQRTRPDQADIASLWVITWSLISNPSPFLSWSTNATILISTTAHDLPIVSIRRMDTIASKRMARLIFDLPLLFRCKTEYHDETPSTPGINCKFSEIPSSCSFSSNLIFFSSERVSFSQSQRLLQTRRVHWHSWRIQLQVQASLCWSETR